jgi:tetratricopeptide (TPR) repeat protein
VSLPSKIRSTLGAHRGKLLLAALAVLVLGTWGLRARLEPGEPPRDVALQEQAETLWQEGRSDEAVALYRQAIMAREAALGPGHPAFGAGLNNLAVMLISTGRYAEAEPLARRALQIAEHALGREHVGYLSSLKNLGIALHYLGRDAEARPLYREALAILTDAYGADDPRTAAVAGDLARLGGGAPPPAGSTVD